MITLEPFDPDLLLLFPVESFAIPFVSVLVLSPLLAAAVVDIELLDFVDDDLFILSKLVQSSKILPIEVTPNGDLDESLGSLRPDNDDDDDDESPAVLLFNFLLLNMFCSKLAARQLRKFEATIEDEDEDELEDRVGGCCCCCCD